MGDLQPGKREPSLDHWDQGTSSGATFCFPASPVAPLPEQGPLRAPSTFSHHSFPSKPEDLSPYWAAQGSVGLEQHLTPNVTPKGSPLGGEHAAGRKGHLCTGFCPTPAHGVEKRMEELPSSTSSFCTLVSKGNAAYAMSDACPSRPHELLDLVAAPSHH